MKWKIDGVKKDKQSVTSDWEMTDQSLIDGVRVKEIKHVIKDNGYLTEVWRADWNLDDQNTNQVFQNTFASGAISGWHAHANTVDRIMVNWGIMKIVLYDSRTDSPTYKMINQFRIGVLRPALVVIPAQVFHAVENIHSGQSALLNIASHAYQYEDPDHWRISIGDPSIPYEF